MKTTHALALCSSMVVAACGGDDGTGGDDDVPTARTYHQDVKPILDAKCGGCHNDDGIAPFSLTTFDEVVNSGPPSALAAAISSGTMPPWPPNPECNDYFADRSLTADQKALVLEWIADGMAEGDAADPAPPLQVEEVRLSRVDLRMEMPVVYTTTATPQYPDEYRCFVLKFPDTVDTTKFVTGFRAVPGNAKVVHHVIAFYADAAQVAQYEQLDADEPGEGYTCFGGPGGPLTQGVSMLGGWAPGGMGSDFPAGTGLRIEPGSAVILQLHYNILAAGAQPDRTAIELKIDDAVEKVATIQPWANPQWLQGTGMRIPAGQADVTHAFQFDASIVRGGEFTIWSAATHQHELGSHNSVSVIRGGGAGTECLLQIDDWDFHWQGSYGLRQPVRFRPGDQLRVECHWDNSPENQRVVDGVKQPPRDVYWGEGTGDEMCVAFFYVTDG